MIQRNIMENSMPDYHFCFMLVHLKFIPKRNIPVTHRKVFSRSSVRTLSATTGECGL